MDIGATNSKVLLYDRSLSELGQVRMETPHSDGPPYRHLDPEPIVGFLARSINELDSIAPVDVIVVSAFGATLACVDADGRLATPIMDYLAEPPQDIERSYTRLAPPFSETFCNVSPASLTAAKQLYWLEAAFPDAFARIRTIMPWSQYLSFRLGGRMTAEISALGVFTQLLDVLNEEYSSLAKQRGWAGRFAPIARAWDDIGELSPGFRHMAFRGRGRILCGVHDSNANYLRYLASGLDRLALLSTGTFIIGFESAADLRRLDPGRDTFSFNDVFGRPVGCCRFFGGREFETLLAGAPASAASIEEVRATLARPVFALPSFSDTGGPVPGSGNRGRIEGPIDESEGARASLATLYAALMTSEALDALDSRSDIVIDGPFARNDLFCSLLAALRPDQRVSSSFLKEGTATGAAVLALMNRDGHPPRLPVELKGHRPAPLELLDAYRSEWRSRTREALT